MPRKNRCVNLTALKYVNVDLCREHLRQSDVIGRKITGNCVNHDSGRLWETIRTRTLTIYKYLGLVRVPTQNDIPGRFANLMMIQDAITT